MPELLTFDAADFTLDVRLKLLDGSSRDVSIDVCSLNDEFFRIGVEDRDGGLAPSEFFGKHQGAVCRLLGVTPEQLPPGMAYKINEACVLKMGQIKKKESGELTPASPSGMESTPSP